MAMANDYLDLDVTLRVFGGFEVKPAEQGSNNVRIFRKKAWYKTALGIASELNATASEIRAQVLKSRKALK